MAISAEDIAQRIQDGVTAFDAGDFETALTKFETARGLMAGIPRIVVGSGQAKSEIEYSPENLDRMIDLTRRRLNEARNAAALKHIPIMRHRGSIE